jgi:hypothetical protein
MEGRAAQNASAQNQQNVDNQTPGMANTREAVVKGKGWGGFRDWCSRFLLWKARSSHLRAFTSFFYHLHDKNESEHGMADAIANPDARPQSGGKESWVGQKRRTGNNQQEGGSVFNNEDGSILKNAKDTA